MFKCKVVVQYYLNDMYHFEKDGLQFKVMKDMDAYHCLRQTFVTKVKDMPDTIRRLLCRAKSWYRHISKFTAKTIIFIKENCLMMSKSRVRGLVPTPDRRQSRTIFHFQKNR